MARATLAKTMMLPRMRERERGLKMAGVMTGRRSALGYILDLRRCGASSGGLEWVGGWLVGGWRVGVGLYDGVVADGLRRRWGVRRRRSLLEGTSRTPMRRKVSTAVGNADLEMALQGAVLERWRSWRAWR